MGRANTPPKFDAFLDSHLFLMRLLEIVQLTLCLVAVRLLTLQSRLKTGYLRLKLFILLLRLRKLVKRKR